MCIRSATIGMRPLRQRPYGDDYMARKKDEVAPTLKIGVGLDERRNVRKEPRPFEELPPDVQRLLLGNGHSEGGRKSTLEILGSKHVLATLLYVAKTSPVLKSDIYNNISRCSNMAEKIDDLYSLGLIDIYHAARTNSNVIIITDKGRTVAGLVEEMVEMIGGSERCGDSNISFLRRVSLSENVAF